MATADPKKKKKKRKKKESLEHKRNRILVALGIFAVVYALDELGVLAAAFGTPGDIYASFALFLVPFLIAGYDVLQKAFNNIRRGKAFDESFLMAVATIGAFAMVLFPDTDPHMAEGAAVMLFYQVGELFQAYAVGKSRKSISAMMDIAPDYANVEQADGSLEQVFPDDIAVGTVIVVKPGERVPIDGVIVEGETQLDTAALTGESVPRPAKTGDDIISGCINMTGLIHVRTTKPFGESTVARVLELVENASEKKARTENFITRFARIYTPAVTGAAAVLALGGGLVTGAWSDWILRGLTFLVVSCPCALVISVPLSFFGGIGGASKLGVLIKGSNYLETLADVDTVVFDKTGTLTNGTFSVVAVHPEAGYTEQSLLEVAALAESFSDHPIAQSVRVAYQGEVDPKRVSDSTNDAGHGVTATIDGKHVVVGNAKMLAAAGVEAPDCEVVGTILHVLVDGVYAGHIVIADTVKADAGKRFATCTPPVSSAPSCSRATARRLRRLWSSNSVSTSSTRSCCRAIRSSASRHCWQPNRARASSPLSATASTMRPCSPARTLALPWALWVPTPRLRPPTLCSWTTSRPTFPARSAWHERPWRLSGRTSSLRWVLSC